jgi:hypothetical protein
MKIIKITFIAAVLIAFAVPVGSKTIQDIDFSKGGRIWVHICYLGKYENSLCFYGGAIPMTGKIRLVNANGVDLTIEPFGCIDAGQSTMSCPPSDGGYWRYTWKYGIDRVSVTLPTPKQQQETICDEKNIKCLPAWYAVDIPPGFQPVEHIIGCSINAPFDFQIENYPTNTEASSSSGGGGGGGVGSGGGGGGEGGGGSGSGSGSGGGGSGDGGSGGGGGCFITTILRCLTK